MRGGLLYGPLVAANGRRKRARIGRLRLLDLLFAGDFDPTLRAELPGAAAGRAEGDTARLLRLALRSERGAGPAPAEYLSDALYTATVCEEGPLPWERTTPVDARAAWPRRALRPCRRRAGPLRPHHGAVRLLPASSSAAAGRRRPPSPVARRALPGGAHARAGRRGRPAHPARVGAPDRGADPGRDAGLRARDGSLGAERVSAPLRLARRGRLLRRPAACGRAPPAGGRFPLCRRFRARWPRCTPSRRCGGRRGPHASPRSG